MEKYRRIIRDHKETMSYLSDDEIKFRTQGIRDIITGKLDHHAKKSFFKIIGDPESQSSSNSCENLELKFLSSR